MKVCLLNDSFAPVIDGVVNVMTNYASHLMQDHGAEVIVGTPKYPGADYSSYPYPVVPYQSFDTTAFVHGYRAGNPFERKSVMELAACGLASVLIEGFCAAEDVTHGRNGYTIEETPEAMAALLGELCGKLDQVHEAGERAMNEIVFLWRDCVRQAYDRYQVILAEKRVGILPRRKKQPSDRLLHLTARIMEEQEHSHRIWKELFHDFKETAVGMMENIYEAEGNAYQLPDPSVRPNQEASEEKRE